MFLSEEHTPPLIGITDDQVETRKCRMTATRNAAILGFSKFMSKGEVYEDLWGTLPPDEWPEDPRDRVKDRRWIGNLLEQAGVRVLQEVFPEANLKHCELTLCRNPEPEEGFLLCLWTCFPVIRDWEAASPDALGDGVGGEVKVDAQGSDEWGEEWSDEVPFGYLIQCQWNMHVLDLNRWFLVRFGPFYEVFIYVVNRDDALIRKLYDHAAHFYFHRFMAKNPPMDAGDKATMRALAQAYSKPRKEWLMADTPELEKLLRDACATHHSKKQLTELDKELKGQIALLCTEHRGLKGEHGKVSVYTSKGHSKPTVRITPAKKED